jgi:hypothetical protein
MPVRKSECRGKSKNCLAVAEGIRDPKVKSAMLQIATAYEVMAGHIDDYDYQLCEEQRAGQAALACAATGIELSFA